MNPSEIYFQRDTGAGSKKLVAIAIRESQLPVGMNSYRSGT